MTKFYREHKLIGEISDLFTVLEDKIVNQLPLDKMLIISDNDILEIFDKTCVEFKILTDENVAKVRLRDLLMCTFRSRLKTIRERLDEKLLEHLKT